MSVTKALSLMERNFESVAPIGTYTSLVNEIGYLGFRLCECPVLSANIP